MQLLLPMALHGPISFPTGAATNCIAWAHWNMQLLLLIVSCGPIGICSCCCRWYRMGPLTYAAASINIFTWAHRKKQFLLPDGFMWAHLHMLLLLLLLSMALHGPISFPTGAAANNFVWAHWNMQLLLPMVLRGPIGICSCCCQWYRMGPLK